MGLRFEVAKAIGAIATGTLRKVFHRPAENFPGKAGLVVDPELIAHLRPRIRVGSVVVVGTNGKTTVTNLLADAFESAGKSVACNRTGANLDSGVATALLHAKSADWGVFESDELWLPRIASQLSPSYVVLLNLFRDQLDRVGEIDRTQDAIAEALASSSGTTLIYNADDPLCQAIAARIANDSIPFGVGEDLGLVQNTVADSGLCQLCDSMLEFDWRQYGQIGSYHCPSCGFRRSVPAYSAENVVLAGGDAEFDICHGSHRERVGIPFPGTYMLYNALAVFAVAGCCGLPIAGVERALRSFDPHNGRLQHYEIAGRRILLNLAKNPTGFNQNLRIVLADPGPKAVAFFINDKEADGHDVSWIWDVDFQELAGTDDLAVFAGGIRRNDMQVRLKYAGIDAQLVDGAADFLAKGGAANPAASFYLIANYTALPDVKSELDALSKSRDEVLSHLEHTSRKCHPERSEGSPRSGLPERWLREDSSPSPQNDSGRLCPKREFKNGLLRNDPENSSNSASGKLVIAHLYPELLNLYGDGGNVTILADRARRRGVEVEVRRVGYGEVADFASADIVFLGGGPDREQRLASRFLAEQADAIRDYVEDDGVLLAICGGYQILGREWLMGEESVPGLGIVDMTTGRAKGDSRNRLVGNIVVKSPLANLPVVGYENHAGRTFLGSGCVPFGTVIGKHGKGNNDGDGADGILYRNVVGTYLHGPLLAKNPEVADWLIAQALARRAAKENRPACELAPLDDAVERAANDYLCARLKVKP